MRNARYVTLIIYIVGIFYLIPLLCEYETHEDRAVTDLFQSEYAIKVYRYKLSKLGTNSVFRWIYALINALGVYIVPLTIIAILNRKLLTSIRLLERRSTEFNAPLPTKQGRRPGSSAYCRGRHTCMSCDCQLQATDTRLRPDNFTWTARCQHDSDGFNLFQGPCLNRTESKMILSFRLAKSVFPSLSGIC